MKKAESNTEEQAQAEALKIKAEIERDQEIKIKYNSVLKIQSEDGEHKLYLKKPSRMAVGYFMSKYGENRVEAVEYILNDACIQEVSDYNYFIQDDVFYGIMAEIISLVSLKKSFSTTL